MIRKGSIVRYKGTDKRFYDGKNNGRLFMVNERKEDKISVYNERKATGKWSTITIPAKDMEVVVE